MRKALPERGAEVVIFFLRRESAEGGEQIGGERHAEDALRKLHEAHGVLERGHDAAADPERHGLREEDVELVGRDADGAGDHLLDDAAHHGVAPRRDPFEAPALAAQRGQLERRLGLPTVVLRVAGIYGPGRGWWFKQFLAGEARIEGEGRRHLNMIHREDVGGCIAAALECGQPGEIYNAVDDEPVAQRDFFAWLAQELGRPLPPAVAEDSGALRKRGVTNKRISIAKLKRELGYRFAFPTFREGYAAAVAAVRAGTFNAGR